MIQALHPTYTFDRNGSAIINLMSGEIISIKEISIEITALIDSIGGNELKTNASNCHHCSYNNNVENCSDTPWVKVP